jgi:hypothetical protein
VWVLWTLYTPLTNFTGGLGSWHPCHESIGPHLNLMHCCRVLAFLVNLCWVVQSFFVVFFFSLSHKLSFCSRSKIGDIFLQLFV